MDGICRSCLFVIFIERFVDSFVVVVVDTSRLTWSRATDGRKYYNKRLVPSY